MKWCVRRMSISSIGSGKESESGRSGLFARFQIEGSKSIE